MSLTPPTTPTTDPAPARGLPWLLLAGGLLGAVASLALTVEKVALLRDASYVPTCSLNPILNCGSVMGTEQAELLGFPNPLLGLLAFPVVAVTGALLLGRVRLPRWYWLGLQVGTTLGVGLVGWLFFQSLYRIGALCPYCMVVWVVVVPVFWYTTLANLVSGRLGAAAARSAVTGFVVRNHGVLLAGLTAVVLALVGVRFWDYWSTLLG